MLHSGSRNIGNITAQNYDKIAQAQLVQQNIKVPGGLNYLEIDSEHGQQYLQVTHTLLAFCNMRCIQAVKLRPMLLAELPINIRNA